MGLKQPPLWRQAARGFLVPLFVWMLAAQSVALPLVRAQTVQALGTDTAIHVLCSASLPLPGDGERDGGPRQVHDFSCCTLACASPLAQPAPVAGAPVVFLPAPAIRPAAYFVLQQGRAPPVPATRPLQPRAPPAIA